MVIKVLNKDKDMYEHVLVNKLKTGDNNYQVKYVSAHRQVSGRFEALSNGNLKMNS